MLVANDKNYTAKKPQRSAKKDKKKYYINNFLNKLYLIIVSNLNET